MTRPRRLHWSLALAVAVLLHIGLALAVFWTGPEERPGAAMAGVAGLEIALGAAGGSAGVQAPVAAQTAAQPSGEPAIAPVSPALTETVPAESATAETKPVAAMQVEPTEPVEAVESVESIEPVEALAAAEEPPVEAVVAEAVVEAVADPAPVPPEKPAAFAETTVATVDPTADPMAVAGGAPLAEQAAETGQAGETAPQGADSMGSGAELGEGAGDNSAGGGTPGAVADYYALLQAWLEQHRRYPSRARSLRQEGTAFLFFVIDRQGQVLESHLERSSGHRLLDEEVLAMVARAARLPPPPAELARASIALVVPVAFTLR